MKEKSFLFLFIFYNVLKITFQQPIIFPIDINELDDEDKDDGNNIKNEDDEKPIVETKELKGKDGSNIKITRIHYHKSKNLNGNNEAITPFQIMRIFDDRVNSIFEDMIRQSMGIKMLLNGLSVFDDDQNEQNDENEGNILKNKTDDENNIFEEFNLDDEEEEEKIKNKENNNSNINENETKNERNEKRVLKKENNEDENNLQKLGKIKVGMDNIKNKIKKGKKKLSKKELIFSRVCKYIFYQIILFTIYILVKKLLEYLEIIDPDNVVEIKIENDETSKLKKAGENKQN